MSGAVIFGPDGKPLSIVHIGSNTGAIAITDFIGDGEAAQIGLRVNAQNQVWNGASYDRAPGNTEGAFAQGNEAHDAADSGNPVKIGGKAVDSEAMPADVAVGDRVNAAYTQKGIAAVTLFTVGGTPHDNLPVSVTTIADVVLAAGTANIGDVDVVSSVLPTGAATSADQSTQIDALDAIVNHVDVLDDWDEVDRAKVNSIVGQAGVAGGSGTVGATTQRVVLATDVALPAGTNAIGKLAANSGVDIGDVDVASVVPGTGATNLGKAEDAAHASGDVGISSLSVRQAALAPLSQADGRYEPDQHDEVGQLKVTAGRIIRSQVTLTRPADTTAYAISDVLSSSTSAPAVITFANCARISGWGGIIQSAVLVDSGGSTTPPTFELWIFDSSVTPDNDNAAFTPTDAEAQKLVCVIPFGTGYAGDPAVGATGNRVFTAQVGMGYQCQGGTSLFGVLVTRSAYTPISAETFQMTLFCVPD